MNPQAPALLRRLGSRDGPLVMAVWVSVVAPTRNAIGAIGLAMVPVLFAYSGWQPRPPRR